MDSREVTFPGYMVYCGLMASLTSLCIGYVIGSPNVPETSIRGTDGSCNPSAQTSGFPECLQFSDLLWGFAVGSFCLGALAGGLIGGTVQNLFGRKRTMFISNIFFILGALLIALTYHQAMFIVGRIVIGFGCGLGGVVAPTYLGEISTGYKWRILFAINAVPALIQMFLLPSLVESPRYLVSRNRLEEARHSLQKLRGANTNIDNEFADIVQLLLGRGSATAVPNQDSAIEEAKGDTEAAVPAANAGSSKNYSIARLFTSECCGLAIIGILMHFLQQASGINGLIYYSTTFLGDVFGPENSKYITVGISCCNLLATLASVALIDKSGRRTLLLISFAGVSLSSVLLVVGAYTDVGVLVVVAVFLYTAFFAIGLGPIPWLLLSELLPTYALSSASAVATAVNWGTNFVIGLVFPTLNNALGNGTFILFAAITAVGFVYTWFFVPETRARSIEEIMAEKGVAPRTDYM
ncbi:hypothetical protein BGZ96_007758 [Linnemannia gamsii]|uniref:Major facilitator superfamily (MFS) profile domain-containing protein n=1 Tax=Linnemannia gamsii TaxID=64522 RepID=A0ABQ7K067_9FUNG|nr:hypothetical protein BGZ96_007758 [Linnemannia gamsii]